MNDDDKKISEKLEPLLEIELGLLIGKEMTGGGFEEAIRTIARRAYRAGFADGQAHANIRTSAPIEEVS